jgi:hypothetical protein
MRVFVAHRLPATASLGRVPPKASDGSSDSRGLVLVVSAESSQETLMRRKQCGWASCCHAATLDSHTCTARRTSRTGRFCTNRKGPAWYKVRLRTREPHSAFHFIIHAQSFRVIVKSYMYQLKGTLPCPKPTPMENTRKYTKNSKFLKTLDLGVSLQGTTFPKNKKNNSADSDRSESLQERRRVRFGNRTLPIISQRFIDPGF